MTDELFENLNDVSPLTRLAIAEVFQYVTMTKVQAQTIEPCLSGADVVAKAKTGTGKTLGFLIPAFEMGVVRNPPPEGQVGVLCLSPTWELAKQTAEEARALLTFHDASFGVHCIVGGECIRMELDVLRGLPPPTVVVATPGRLVTLLENPGLAALFRNLRVLIFDEADRLLDMGFRPQIQELLDVLPGKESRQTLLFSATFPERVSEIAQVAMRCQGERAYRMIDTIGVEEVPTHRIPQSFIVTSMEYQMPMVMCELAQEMKRPGHKVIVFLPTARHAQLYARVFNTLVALGVFQDECLEIHSKKSHYSRTMASNAFRNATEAILFSSDVSARGMDYPGVTFVLQCGLPLGRTEYVHRLGRTARAGKSGSGLLVLADFERAFLREIKDLPIEQREAVDRAELDSMRRSVDDALARAHGLDRNLGKNTYQAWLGCFKSHLTRIGWTKTELVRQGNYYATKCLNLEDVPVLSRDLIEKLTLTGFL